MFGFIPIIIAIMAGGLVLTFTSQTFADGVSRYIEAALDAVEYRLALRARRQAESERGRERFARAASVAQTV